MRSEFDFSGIELQFELENRKVRVLNAKKEVFFESFPNHMHGFFELHYIFGGHGELICLGNRYPLLAGCVYLNGLNVSHEQRTDTEDNMTEYSLAFDLTPSRGRIQAADGLAQRLDGMKLWIGEDRRGIGELFRQIERELTAREIGFRDALESLCRLLLIEVIRSFAEPTDQVSRHAGITSDRRKFIMDEAFIYLYRDMTLSSLAALLNLSERQTARDIRSYYGMSFTEFRGRSRLSAAARLLTERPDMTVAEVGEVVGFSSAAHFRKLFAAFSGETPAAYRKRAWEDGEKK
ncbi:MAG: AraC family transcriptional regulator [Clostridia bacterium]|nr:AraC family transcriptional regulator [Clostridia bacterium]